MEDLNILAYLAMSLGVKMSVTVLHSLMGKKKKLVGKVADLVVFPVKSCQGVHVKEAQCSYAGLQTTGTDFTVKDRHWMVTTADYTAVSLIDHPKASLISVEIQSDGLMLGAPSLNKIKIPFVLRDAPEVTTKIQMDEVQGLDCGDEVAHWLQQHFGIEGLRMVYSAPQLPLVIRTTYKETLGKDGGIAFAWSTPISLMCEASMEDLNKRLEEPVSTDVMRMNIIVDGADAYEEESWLEAIVGEVQFSVVKLCERCLTVEVDIDRGERYKKNGPLSMLRKYRPMKKETRYSPVLGIKYKTVTPGRIKIGDPVYVLQ